jgi:hypothetical protein
LLALDVDAARLRQIAATFARLAIGATRRCGRPMPPTPAPGGKAGLFDAILLDAPCSATGVVRRQPDILLHRRESDIDALAASIAAAGCACGRRSPRAARCCMRRARSCAARNDAQVARVPGAQTDATLDVLDARFGAPCPMKAAAMVASACRAMTAWTASSTRGSARRPSARNKAVVAAKAGMTIASLSSRHAQDPRVRDTWLFWILALLVIGRRHRACAIRGLLTNHASQLAAKQMVESGNWLFPHRGIELYSDKPPMLDVAGGRPHTHSSATGASPSCCPSLLASLGTLWCVDRPRAGGCGRARSACTPAGHCCSRCSSPTRRRRRRSIRW